MAAVHAARAIRAVIHAARAIRSGIRAGGPPYDRPGLGRRACPVDPDALLDRRQFLRRGGATVAPSGRGLARSAGRLFERDVDRPSSTGSGATATTGSSGPPEWAALSVDAQREPGRAGSPTYTTSRELYNERFDDRVPAAIAYCASPSTSSARGLRPRPRRADGGAVRSPQLRGPLLVPGPGDRRHPDGRGHRGPDGRRRRLHRRLRHRGRPAGSATVGAGARLIDVYSTLGASGLLSGWLAARRSGIAGLTLGGGIGVFGRKYGLRATTFEPSRW